MFFFKKKDNENDEIKMLTKKAKKGDGKAQWELACAYFYAKGVKKDLDKAKEWAEKAYDSGIRDAGLLLEDIEIDGDEDLW